MTFALVLVMVLVLVADEVTEDQNILEQLVRAINYLGATLLRYKCASEDLSGSRIDMEKRGDH